MFKQAGYEASIFGRRDLTARGPKWHWEGVGRVIIGQRPIGPYRLAM
jgi:hypothetical protein